MSSINVPRFVLSVVAVFIFMFAYEFVVHGHLMMPLYNETPQLWRPEAEMQANLFPWGILSGVGLALVVTWLFTRHYENKGLHEGVRFGLWLGLLMGVMQFGAYNYLPISLNLALAWFAVMLVEGIGMGVVLSLTYRA